MIKFPIQAKTKGQLTRQSDPQAAGQPEATYHVIYDTATYVTGVTTVLQFFNQGRATQRLTNFGGQGRFPDPQYFELRCITVDPIIPPGAIAWADMWGLLYGTGVAGSGAPNLQITYNDKVYGPYPLSQAHGSGGLTGFGTVNNTEYANNSVPDGGIWLGDSITFAPNQGFQVAMTWDAAIALVANRNIKVNFHGVLHRKVV